MLSAPVRLALVADRRATVAVLGIALGAAFAVIGFGVPAFLEASSVEATGPLARGDVVVRFVDLPPGVDPIVLIRVYEVRLADGREVVLAALSGEGGVPIAGTYWPPLHTLEEWPVGLDLPPPLEMRLTRSSEHASGRIPAAWLMVAWEDLDPVFGAGASYVLVRGDHLPAGSSAVSAPGAEAFLRASAEEVGVALWLVVLFSCALVALLTYEFLRSEVRDKRREIGIWRSVGLRRRDVFALLVVRAGAIGAVGAFAGAGLAAIVAVVVGSRLGERLVPAPGTLGAVLLALVFAAILGAALPAARIARIGIQRLLEAGP